MKINSSKRESGLELYRIIFMMLIVAHHYVVNSGVWGCLASGSEMRLNDAFLWLFGGWGKIGINCFVLITGYFMCRREITLRKFLHLVLWVLFYYYTILPILIIAGYVPLTPKALILSCIPLHYVTNDFVSAFLIFFLCIPFLNKLLSVLSRRQHMLLLGLLLFVYSVLPSLLYFQVEMGYVTWFSILFLVAAYLRLYPVPPVIQWLWSGGGVICMAMLCMMSILGLAYFTSLCPYLFVADSNKILALVFSVSVFMYFKNLKMRPSPIINTIAASAFGVLLIHAHSDAMRTWLWKDFLDNVSWVQHPYCILHAIGSVLAIYIVCTLVDFVRRRYFEKPLLDWSERVCQKIWSWVS